MPKGSTLHQIFCVNIRARRSELGLTQQAVADYLDITQPAYAQYEHGRRVPGLDVVERIAAALDATALDLLRPLDQSLVSQR